MTLAADAPTTDGSESLATDTSGIVLPSQDRTLFQSTDPGPEPHGLRDIVNPPGDKQPVAGAEARERKTGPGRAAVENRA